MVMNTHTFEKGEKFNGNLEDETYRVIEVNENSIKYEYIVDNEVLAERKNDKETCRLFIQTGYWSNLLV
jgi:hypothetical protein